MRPTSRFPNTPVQRAQWIAQWIFLKVLRYGGQEGKERTTWEGKIDPVPCSQPLRAHTPAPRARSVDPGLGSVDIDERNGGQRQALRVAKTHWQGGCALVWSQRGARPRGVWFNESGGWV